MGARHASRQTLSRDIGELIERVEELERDKAALLTTIDLLCAYNYPHILSLSGGCAVTPLHTYREARGPF